MVVNYFTFGCGQTFKNHYVVIKARDSNHCREIMFSAFGTKWSIQYDENDFNPDEYGYQCLVEITENDHKEKIVKVFDAVIKHT